MNMRKSILAPSQSNVSGSVLRLKAVEMRARPQFVFPVPFQTGQFTTHAPAAVLAEISSHLVSTSGRLRIVVPRGCIEALRPCR